jgi:hypothetical protein
MATAQQRTPREVIEFTPNVPVTVALKFNQGRKIVGQHGERMMYTAPDDRIFFVSLEVAGQIEAAGINVRENFTITQKWDGVKGSPRTWEVARLAGEQPNGTLVVPNAPPSSAPTSAGARATPKPPASATDATPSGARSLLVQEADALVDAFAQVLERALTTYQGRIKPDEVRSLLLSAYIQRRQLSTCA